MILTILPVPPPPVRPSIADYEGGTREDDLTLKLVEIIKGSANLRRAEDEGTPEDALRQFEQLLQVWLDFVRTHDSRIHWI